MLCIFLLFLDPRIDGVCLRSTLPIAPVTPSKSISAAACSKRNLFSILPLYFFLLNFHPQYCSSHTSLMPNWVPQPVTTSFNEAFHNILFFLIRFHTSLLFSDDDDAMVTMVMKTTTTTMVVINAQKEFRL